MKETKGPQESLPGILVTRHLDQVSQQGQTGRCFWHGVFWGSSLRVYVESLAGTTRNLLF